MTSPQPMEAPPVDILKSVHHHCPEHLCDSALEGLAVPSLCGFVKRIDPAASEKPCCPMCAFHLAELGHRCNGRPLGQRQGDAS